MVRAPRWGQKYLHILRIHGAKYVVTCDRIPLPPLIENTPHATIADMAEVTRAVTWEAPEHHHIEKSSDWFWIVGIISVTGALIAFFFGNFLFALLILVAGVSTSLVALRRPRIIPFAVTTRGVRIDDELYPYSSLESFYIDGENYPEVRLLLKSKKLHLPLLILPLPDEYVDDIDDLLSDRLPEEELEEPLFNVILEYLGV